jgi:2-acylglycerol O-acyltransferase 2
LQHKHKERIMLLARKGFVRIAVEAGLNGGIIPVYHYGNTQVRGRRCGVLERRRASA